MKSVFLSLFMSGIIIIGTISPIFAYIPPTVAYDNITASNGSAMAQTYDSHINFQGLRGMQVFASNNSQTIYFNATLSNGTKITPITCSSNYQLHSINSLGIFTCALNNNTGGPALDTMQNLTPAQAYVYAKNSTDFNFQFRGMNFTGSLTGSNSSNLITIHGNIYQNNTGANLGTHGIGIYSSMSGSILQFLSLLGGQGISTSSNSTNGIISTNFKVNNQTCSTGYFVSAYDNKTGNYVCTQDSDPFLTSAILSINGNNNAAQTINGTSPIVITNSGSSHTVSCPTCSISGSSITSINSQTGPSITITNDVLHNTKITSSGNIIKIDSNNTAQVIPADNGESLISSKVNATENKLMTIRNQSSYVLYNHNSTSISPSFQFKVNTLLGGCLSNYFISTYSNVTGVFGCTQVPTQAAILSINSNTASSQLISGTNGQITETDFGSIHALGLAIKVNNQTCSTGYFVSAYDNKTGNYVCNAGNGGTIKNSQNIGKGTGSYGVLASSTSTTIRGKNMTAGTGISLSGNTTDITINSLITQGFTAIQNIGKGGFGPLKTSGNTLQSKNITCGVGMSCSTNSTDIRINSTALLSAITSINSQTGPSITIVRQSGNTTITNNTNSIIIGLGINPVITGGSPQTFTKKITHSNTASTIGLNLGTVSSFATSPRQGDIEIVGNSIKFQDNTNTTQTITPSSYLTSGTGVTQVNTFTNKVNITRQIGNTTISNNTGIISIGFGVNPVIIGGAYQDITKGLQIDKLNDTSKIVSGKDTTKAITFLNSGMTTGITTTFRNNATSSQSINIPATRETETLAIRPTINYTTPSNPATTTSTTGVMSNLFATFTPQVTGRIFIDICGGLDSGTAGDGAGFDIRYGTSPISEGTAIGNTVVGTKQIITSSTLGKFQSACSIGYVTGLGINTKYYVQIGKYAATAGTASFQNFETYIEEK